MNVRLLSLPVCCFAALVCPGSDRPAARSDEFVLAGGGRLLGELANAAEAPREKYEVKLATGGVVTLSKDQVSEVVRRTADELEYDRIRHDYPDTVAGHMALADWCRDHKLTELRTQHLTRVVELEPNHQQARAALGYNRIQGQWRTRAEHLSALGKVQYKGQWRYPQEIEIIEAKQKSEQTRALWYGNLKRWRDWLAGDKSQAAITELSALTDPAAVPALKDYMAKEENEEVRKLYVRALAKIGTPAAEMFLAERSLHDPSSEIRLTCLDLLDDVPQPMLVDYYIQQLRDKNNDIVNRAGVALSRFKDPRAVSSLIDALVTKHKFAVTTGSPNGGINAGQGSGGAGISMGSSTRIVTIEKQNEGVLDALVTLIGAKVNYRFDVTAWKYWYAGQKKMRLLDIRRS